MHDDTQGATPPDWRGFHHVALATPDLDATLHFYGELLGMAVGPVLDGPAGRHCFVTPGPAPAFGLHFFELRDAQVFAYPAEFPRFAVVPGALQHLAFALPDAGAGARLRSRLAAHAIPMTDVSHIGPISNTLFRDNNGLLLEATWAREA